jgi:hypothetical protein
VALVQQCLIPQSNLFDHLHILVRSSRISRLPINFLKNSYDECLASHFLAQSLLDELSELEALVGKIAVPLSYADELYALRNHIELVRQKLLRA